MSSWWVDATPEEFRRRANEMRHEVPKTSRKISKSATKVRLQHQADDRRDAAKHGEFRTLPMPEEG
jgi:hypothetical protein